MATAVAARKPIITRRADARTCPSNEPSPPMAMPFCNTALGGGKNIGLASPPAQAASPIARQASTDPALVVRTDDLEGVACLTLYLQPDQTNDASPQCFTTGA